MNKVYLVYYDNGQNYEDHYVAVSKVFLSLSSATKYADENNAAIQTFTSSLSKEEYQSQNLAEKNGYSYDQFVEHEMDEWEYMRDGKYYVSEIDVHS